MATESITIRDTRSGAAANILVGLGFNSYSFQVMLDNRPLEILWSSHDFASGQQRPSSSGIPILFPFPGRIQGVQLAWQGQTYLLEEGDGRGNAIHGFVHLRPWRVIEQSESAVVGQFQASIDDPELLKCWPADFRITASYQLDGNALKMNYQVDNPDERPLPCGLGTHPYFRVPLGGASADECLVKLPVSRSWQLHEMNATGKLDELERQSAFHQGLRFGDMSYDNVFGGLMFAGDVCTTSMTDPDSGRRVVMSFDRAFRECVVYNPSHREAVCIEPYTCVPDPFRLSRQGIDAGLRVLDPGASFAANVEIRVESFRSGEVTTASVA